MILVITLKVWNEFLLVLLLKRWDVDRLSESGVESMELKGMRIVFVVF